ncbi:MAG: hypothetical protein JSS43_04180 [Proteobacteria bacterium]|nr:hypothetical protein [Pseudomonadota bacterium]
MLLIEIRSPSKEAETRENIRAYSTIASVQEILALHDTRFRSGLPRRSPDGT